MTGLLARLAEADPDALAHEHRARRMTHGELAARADALAARRRHFAWRYRT